MASPELQTTVFQSGFYDQHSPMCLPRDNLCQTDPSFCKCHASVPFSLSLLFCNAAQHQSYGAAHQMKSLCLYAATFQTQSMQCLRLGSKILVHHRSQLSIHLTHSHCRVLTYPDSQMWPRRRSCSKEKISSAQKYLPVRSLRNLTSQMKISKLFLPKSKQPLGTDWQKRLLVGTRQISLNSRKQGALA